MANAPEPGSAVAGRADPARAHRLPHTALLALNLCWFANNVHWGALSVVILPSQVDKLLGNKELNLPLAVVGGTIVGMLAHPLAGALSDRTTARLGRRRPWLLWGTLPNLLGLALLARAASLPALALGYLVVTLANNVATAPWAAIIADRVPPGQRGAAAGWNGLCTVLGTVAGALAAGLIVDKGRPLDEYRAELLAAYGLIAAVQLAAVLATAWLVPETPLAARRPFGRAELARTYWVPPGPGGDFFWVCLTRFLVLQGIYSVFFFLQYYLEDVLGLPGERTLGVQFIPAVMLAALATAYVAGGLSDRWGRKPLIYLSGATMSVACFAFVFVQRPLAVPICGALFGIGYGAYTSVDWALACDVLPDREEYGRDMGLWAVTGILPQVLGIVLGGLTLAALRPFPHHLGYTLLFCLALAWFVLGTLLIRRVKGAR